MQMFPQVILLLEISFFFFFIKPLFISLTCAFNIVFTLLYLFESVQFSVYAEYLCLIAELQPIPKLDQSLIDLYKG